MSVNMSGPRITERLELLQPYYAAPKMEEKTTKQQNEGVATVIHDQAAASYLFDFILFCIQLYHCETQPTQSAHRVMS
jgi:hypothetical protein